MPPFHRSGRLQLLLAPVLLLGCSESVAPTPTALNIAITGGDAQSGMPRAVLPETLSVRVMDDAGLPMRGVPVRWAASDSTAEVMPLSTVTSESGRAHAVWRLGMMRGAQRASIHVAGLPASASFHATVTSRRGMAKLMHGTSSVHMCALDAEGRAWCWGTNVNGQLGRGEVGGTQAPDSVHGGHRFRILLGGISETCGLRVDGELWCWGGMETWAGPGFVGGTTTGSPVPVRTAAPLRFQSVDMDIYMACGVTEAGDGFCWGSGALGDGRAARTSLEPVRVSAGHVWRSIGVGDDRACGATVEGSVWCWTYLTDPLLWLGIEGPGPLLEPVLAPVGIKASEVAVGGYNQCAVSEFGGGFCWGNWLNGGPYREPAEPLLGHRAAARIVIGWQTLFAADGAGRLWMWGNAPSGNHVYFSPEPRQLRPDGPWLDFSLSDNAAFGILERDSVVYEWRGLSSSSDQLLPAAVPWPEP